jgi:RIO-like serine/threonine protein kinase
MTVGMREDCSSGADDASGIELCLKHDAFGTTRLVRRADVSFVERDTRAAHPAVRWLARRLAAREVTALTVLHHVPALPRVLGFDGAVVRRSYVPGVPLYEAPPRSRAYFIDALRLLRQIHRAGITHNDLAKEANWLVAPGDVAGIIDFQLATYSPTRGNAFRLRAYEDLRHLLKHKRTYRPDGLTARQQRVLARPTFGTRIWRTVVKPVYRRITRDLLGWPDRLGPLERRG